MPEVEKEPTAGTPEPGAPEGGDAGQKPVAGTPSAAADDGDAGKEPTYEQLRELYLSNKDKAEKYNDLERENAELKTRVGAAATDRPDPQASREQQELETLEKHRHDTWLLTQGPKPDPVAVVSLIALDEAIDNRRARIEDRVFAKMDPDHRDQIRELYDGHRDHLPTPQVAELVYFGRLFKQQAKNGGAPRKPAPNGSSDPAAGKDVVGTYGRPVTARADAARAIDESAFEQENERLRSDGQHAAVRQRQQELLDGKIKLNRGR